MCSWQQCVSAGDIVEVWSVQFGECYKWRVIPTLEEYEEIRSKFVEDPPVCSKKPGCSWDQPADMEYDNSRTWVIDKPNLPKTLSGFRRKLSMRRDNSKFDCYYDLMEGRRKSFRSQTQIAKFLDENPEYKKDMSPSDFCFSSPKVDADTLPIGIDRPIMLKTLMPIMSKTVLPIMPKTVLTSIPVTPGVFNRILVPWKDNSRCDTYYDLIEGGVKKKRFRSKVEISRFLDENPDYKKEVLSKITGDTVMGNAA